MGKKNKNKKMEQGPSKPSKVTDKAQEWHAVSSDDEEAYVNEWNQLMKD